MSLLRKQKLLVSSSPLFDTRAYPFCLFFMYTHVSVTQWQLVRQKIAELASESKLQVVKNKIILHHFIENKEKGAALFQGPTCMIASPNESQMRAVVSLISNFPEFSLVGGKIEKDLFHSADIKAYCKLPSAQDVHKELLASMQNTSPLVSTLQQAHLPLINLLQGCTTELYNVHLVMSKGGKGE